MNEMTSVMSRPEYRHSRFGIDTFEWRGGSGAERVGSHVTLIPEEAELLYIDLDAPVFPAWQK